MGRDLAVPAPKSNDEGVSAPTLYELLGAYREIAQLLDTDDNGDDEETRANLEDALQELGIDITKHGERLAMVLRQKEAEAEWLDHQAQPFADEAKRLKDRAKVKRNGIKRLKDWIKDAMGFDNPETVKVSGSLLSLTLAKKPEKGKLKVVDLEQLPKQYRIVTVKVPESHLPRAMLKWAEDISADTDALNADYKEKGVIPKGTEEYFQRNLLVR